MHDQNFTFSEVVFFPSTLLGKSANVIKLGKGDTQIFGHFFRSWKLEISHWSHCNLYQKFRVECHLGNSVQTMKLFTRIAL